jgi:hypothetical protein
MSVAPSLNISGYNWRNGFENNNIWVIYSDTFSQGLTTQGNSVPTIWGTPQFTEAGLLNLINVLPARAGLTAFTVLSDAIAWLYGEGKYFLSNQNYPFIPTTNLVYFMDAGYSASYPNVGSTLYDLSGNGATGDLLNGTGWNNLYTKSSLVFDGTDDKVYCNNNSAINFDGNQVYTVLSWIYPQGAGTTWHGIFSKGNDQQYALTINSGSAFFHYETNLSAAAALNSSAGSVVYNRWQMVGVRYKNPGREIILNGTVIASDSATVSSSSNTEQLRIGEGNTAEVFRGNINSTMIWDRNLTDDEILQAYYKAPIVTSGLIFNIDAANIVSYPNTGTNWYNLASTTSNATLNNSPTFSNDAGGCFVFDGTDDYVSFSNPLNQAQLAQVWTVQAWINIQSKPPQILVDGLAAGLYIEFVQGDNSLLYLNGGVNDYYTYGGQFTNQGWVLATFRFNNANGDRQIWRNLTNISTGGPNFTSTPASQGGTFTIGSNGSSTILGKVANVLIYNRYLTDNEIQQNYSAYQNRFESYQAFANGGTVTTLTQNGINYRVHTFNSSGTLSVTKGGDVEVLMVAGGGGGGSGADSFWEAGGGGGAGGLINNTGFPVTDGTNYTVTIGAGGAGGLNQTNTTPSNRSGNGSNTTFSTLTTVGGGGGGGAYYAPDNGGSGGAAEGRNLYPNASGTQYQGYNGGSGNGLSSTDGAGGGGAYYAPDNGGSGGAAEGRNLYPNASGTQYQGYNGGSGNGFSSTDGAGGGGGGAGGIGQNGQAVYPFKGGDGGIGRIFTFSGNTGVYYGGGGGGKTAVSGAGVGGVGGLGGGGNGGVAGGSAVGTSGTANTGGGGGGGLSTSTPTGSGGSGVVMIRYIIP